MLQLWWIPVQIACVASLFGGALDFKQWLKQPLTLIYNEKLENTSKYDLASYFNKVEKRLIKVINRNLDVKKFLLHTSYDDEYESQVTSLIRYALRSQVEELDLSFWLECGPYVHLVLDEAFFLNSHLTHLNLSFNFPNLTRICWKNLKSLSLSNLTNLTEDFSQKILSGSPVLETFKLDNCEGDDLYDLIITSDSVKVFEISGDRQLRYGGTGVTLEAPNITSLTIKGSLVLSQLQVFRVTSLVEATIDYYNEDDIGAGLTHDDEDDMIYRHVKILRRACGNGLKLGDICLEIHSCVEANGSCKEDYAYEYIQDLGNLLM